MINLDNIYEGVCWVMSGLVPVSFTLVYSKLDQKSTNSELLWIYNSNFMKMKIDIFSQCCFYVYIDVATVWKAGCSTVYDGQVKMCCSVLQGLLDNEL